MYIQLSVFCFMLIFLSARNIFQFIILSQMCKYVTMSAVQKFGEDLQVILYFIQKIKVT